MYFINMFLFFQKIIKLTKIKSFIIIYLKNFYQAIKVIFIKKYLYLEVIKKVVFFGKYKSSLLYI